MSLSRFYRWLEPRATPRTIALGVLLWLASATGVLFLQSRVSARSGGLAVPDVQTCYTPAELYGMLDRYGEAGRTAFLHFTVYDLFYPFVAYGVAALALVWLTRPLAAAGPRLARVVLLPLAGLVVELLEQLCFLGILFRFPTRVPALAVAASALTVMKFALIASIAVALVVFGLRRARLAGRRLN